jgi:2-methylaconitate cis-trans-isomerase PrpF
MLAGVGPFAIERGLVAAQDGETRVLIYDVNTQSRIEAVVQTPGGRVNYDAGAAAIDGVPGTAAPLMLNFMDIVGSKTGKLLPTGNVVDEIDGIGVSCVDVAMPMILMRASDFGITGHESRKEIDANKGLLEKIEPIRLEAGRRMGLGDVSQKVIPKVGLLAAPAKGGDITSRYFTPWALHATHAVTGGICISSALSIEGTVAHQVARSSSANPRDVVIEHPSGQIEVRLETAGRGAALQVVRAGTLRTARLIMRGEVMVPERAVGGWRPSSP